MLGTLSLNNSILIVPIDVSNVAIGFIDVGEEVGLGAAGDEEMGEGEAEGTGVGVDTGEGLLPQADNMKILIAARLNERNIVVGDMFVRVRIKHTYS